ncbi:Predicted SnoaL-like aldol condensation-catalyzing enzyme [Tenacibaculum sp. MAR_2009_124]|uniref:nuclear transport factor 2 family protein n=1 Tax=Tenacibaculum sp. MAR_2009_124 TaxID=1250059 RepID=UPI00089AFD63|nr:ester cyclase [Tenacibaculum sp. MAR_2009_124]SEB52970.1 Predicted SnoaL-like aldol condensation-catalyzing enzyme [Tenacibaculum sp. MAR_2009_124]
MKQISLLLLTVTTYLSVGCDSSKKTNSITNTKEKMEIKDLKSVASEAQEAFFTTYNAEEVKKHFSNSYIQHNPHVPTGIEPVLGFLPMLKKAGTSYKTHRILQDGNFIVMHNTYSNAEAFGAKDIVTFDVYRIENDKIVEHWDAINPIITETVSGRSQFDGPTKIEDLDKTESNKALVKQFVDDVLFAKSPTKITDYVSTEKYHQHNTNVADGLEGLNNAIDYLVSQNDMFVYKKLHKVLGEGNFVLTMSEGEWHSKAHSFYDLFRIEDGKIVEHWDVIQEIPEKLAHTNGMF